MEILYLLIPLSLLLVGAIVWLLFWAVRAGQFDDLERPAHDILMDDDGVKSDAPSEEGASEGKAGPDS
jgi:cbb3-type cytochrome oxidase maturation protein